MTTQLTIIVEEELIIIRGGVGRGKYKRPDNLKGMTGHWSKWGKVNGSYQETVGEVWFCQSCSQAQPKELSPYLFPFDNTEHLRVCASCFQGECTALLARLQSQN